MSVEHQSVIASLSDAPCMTPKQSDRPLRSAPGGSSPKVSQRFALIDALRGFAALWVAVFHFHAALSDSGETQIWWQPFDAFCTVGHLGVAVFFVLSGFVMAYTTDSLKIDRYNVASFIARRSIRLDPTYWFVILLAVGVAWLKNEFEFGQNRVIPSTTTILANMFYVNKLLGFPAIVSVGWTLCLEVQFYLVLILGIWFIGSTLPIAWRNVMQLMIFGLLACYSLLVHSGHLPLPIRGLFVSSWFMFFLGVLCWWSLSRKVGLTWLVTFLAMSLATRSAEAVAACATASVIVIAGHWHGLGLKVGGKFMQYFGLISYSFYLIHPLVGNRPLFQIMRWNDGPLGGGLAIVAFFAAIASSTAVAHVVHRLIERPSHRMARRMFPLTYDPDLATATKNLPTTSRQSLLRGFKWNLRAWLSAPTRFRGISSWPLLALISLVAIWATEIYWVQYSTLVGAQSGGPRFDYFAPKIRFLLDVLFIAFLCVTLRRSLLAIALVASCLICLLLVTYTNYFQRPLSLLTVVSSWREGMQYGHLAMAWIPPRAFVVLGLLFTVKANLLFWATPEYFSRKRRLALASACLAAYVMLYGITLRLDPLSRILTTCGVARLGIIRGYAGPWFAEWYYFNDGRLLANATERTKITSDKLTPVETPIHIHDKLAIIQFESLDYNVIDYKVNGREVTPFLNSLKKRSLFYKAHCYHVIGSADADFTMLVGGAPAMNVLNYSLPNHPYDLALPWYLEQYGYQTSGMHGNTGNFYSRRSAYEKMGFADLYFREELEGLNGFEIDDIGVRDRDVLRFSAIKLRESKGPTCHFVITLTSHSPYAFLHKKDDLFIREPKSIVDRYFNHIHYVDACLRDYVTALGSNATVLIYADHPTEVGQGDFSPSRESTGEYVPVFIYNANQNLAELQRTRNTIARSGDLKMLDISSYLRNQVATSPRRSDQPVDASNAESKP